MGNVVKFQGAPFTAKEMAAIYVLLGQDLFLLEEAAQTIKKQWLLQGETDQQSVALLQGDDWQGLVDAANSYSLFADHLLINAYFEKKTFDQASKASLSHYLNNPNLRTLIILHAYQIPLKQCEWLKALPRVTLIQAVPLNEKQLQYWVTQQLRSKNIQYEAAIPELITQYTQGNMLACAQAVEQLTLTASSGKLSLDTVRSQLVDQCDFNLYELADACLTANLPQALHLLRWAQQTKVESTLVLWLMMQEVRLLIQLVAAKQQGKQPATLYKELKIWPQRIKLYERPVAQFSLSQLYNLLKLGQQIDEQIKTGQTGLVWQGLDQLAVKLCASPKVGTGPRPFAHPTPSTHSLP